MVLSLLFSCRTEIENTNKDAIGMENLIGISLTQDERDTLLTSLVLNRNKYDTLRMLELTNDIPLPLYYNPLIEGKSISKGNDKYLFQELPIKKPSRIEDCAFYTIGQLAYLISTKQITSEELTRMYIKRLKKYGRMPRIKII